MNDFLKVFFSKDFWTKKEISYQYVHVGNSILITLVMLYVTNLSIFMLSGLAVGIGVEAYQWINGNHKKFDAIRDLLFWLIGGLLGYLIYVK